MDFAGKLLLMLQSVKRGLALEPDNPQLHECLVQFLNTGMFANKWIADCSLCLYMLRNIQLCVSS